MYSFARKLSSDLKIVSRIGEFISADLFKGTSFHSCLNLSFCLKKIKIWLNWEETRYYKSEEMRADIGTGMFYSLG